MVLFAKNEMYEIVKEEKLSLKTMTDTLSFLNSCKDTDLFAYTKELDGKMSITNYSIDSNYEFKTELEDCVIWINSTDTLCGSASYGNCSIQP